ncbi:MAG: SEC59/DGK1/VTE5 family protein [Ignavibacteriales bacterium]|nr:SEC59/DGK1/VTE5 family protein [Ignavibacteriales bacterium]
MVERTNIGYRAELLRKGIHLCSLSIPIIYFFITREAAVAILLPITAGFLAVDLARYYHPPTSKLFYEVFGGILRSHEVGGTRRRLNGATYVLFSATLCVLVFPKLITVTAFAILIVSDSSAALIGRRWGKRPLLSKSWEGTVAFFVSALMVVVVAPKYGLGRGEFAIGAAGALLGAVVELVSIHIDDNFSIPVAIGSAMWLLYFLVYNGTPF